jgi:hypothetical protein
LCAALLALIPLAVLLQPGMPPTADGQVHLLRTWEVARLLRDGVLYPRWAPDFYLGYGYPFFNFYAPGAHLAAALLALAGLGIVRGVVTLQALALALYPVGAYLAARGILPADDRRVAERRRRALPGAWRGPAALLSASVYLYAPLRFRELFVQGNLSQWLALALLPWCAWLLIGVAQRGGLGRVVAAGAMLAALLYAHHPSAFLGWPSLLAFAFLVAVLSGRQDGMAEAVTTKNGTASRVEAVIGAFALATALAAPFWLPSLLELRDVNINAISAGSFQATLNLLPLRELLALPAVQDRAALNPPMPNSLGVLQFVLAAVGLGIAIWWVIRRAGERRVAQAPAGELRDWSSRQAGLALSAAGVLWLLSLALMLPAAGPIWEALPLARWIAFPWRLLGPALLWSALLSSAALYAIPERGRIAVLAGLLLLVPLSVAPYLFPRPFSPEPEPNLASIAHYEMAGGAWATASANEYLPRWVADPRPPAQPQGSPRVDQAPLPAGSKIEPLALHALDYHYAVDLPGGSHVVLQRFYFPGWQAWVDGRPVQIQPAEPYGQIAVAVPAGHHELRVALGSTPAQRAGGGLALVAVAVVLVLMVLGRGRRRSERLGHTHVDHGRLDHEDAKHKEREEGSRDPEGDHRAIQGAADPGYRAALAVIGVILAVTVVKIGLIGPHTTWFRVQSSAEQPAGMQHAVNARFANGVELLGYDLEQPDVRQGDELNVRLYWRAWQPATTNARPFLHLDAPTGEVTWANQTKLNAGDKPMTAWPAGFYVVDDYRIPAGADTPPVVAQLRAGLLGPGGELVPLVDGGDTAALGPVRVTERAPLRPADLPNHDQVFNLGSEVRLVGYDVEPLRKGPGLALTFYWQALAPVPADYTVFVHVQDAAGRPLGQQDSPPLHGWYPSTRWTTGQIIPDRYEVALPASALTQGLRVAAGLYTPADGRRAPVGNAQGAPQPNNEIVLPIKIH